MRISTALAAASVALCIGHGAAAKDIVIHAGRFLDGETKAERTQVSILVHDDRITGVQNGFVSPAGADVIDLSNATVLPGMIDCHDHITATFDGGNPVAETVTRTDFDDAFLSVGNARNTLMAGFTTIRRCWCEPSYRHRAQKGRRAWRYRRPTHVRGRSAAWADGRTQRPLQRIRSDA
ncbi:MAG: hypothetical protein WDM89_13140 [Rhizomicrobium sp.]